VILYKNILTTVQKTCYYYFALIAILYCLFYSITLSCDINVVVLLLGDLVVFVGWLIVLITILIQRINILGEPSRNIGCLLDG